MKAMLPLMLLWIWVIPAYGQDDRFSAWLSELRWEALEFGIRAEIFDAAMYDVRPSPRIIRLDRKQPETTKTFTQYLHGVLTPARIQKGRELLQEHGALLEEIGSRYGVQPEYIVALWGIETSFGANMGGYYVPEALATLAYDGRRSDYFRGELLDALKILNAGHIAPAEMKGSWAGAMGQTQFMPSSYREFSIDYDGDGAADIWNTPADVFASIANYLAQNGWDKGAAWGRKVKIPADFDIAMVNAAIEKSITDWKALGIRKFDGSSLPDMQVTASLICPGGEKKDAFLIYSNYKTLLKWNRSLYFATTVGLFADELSN